MDNNLLAQLKDIRLPERISIWPLSYGWWIIISALVLIFLALFVYWIIKKIRKIRQERLLRNFYNITLQSAKNNSNQTLAIMSGYLKRIAIDKYKNEDVHLLYGQEWLDFLDSKIDTNDFSTGVGSMLAQSYQNIVITEEQAKKILGLIENWIKKAL